MAKGQKKKDRPDSSDAQPVLVDPKEKDNIDSCEFNVVIDGDGDITLDILDSKGKALTNKVNGATVFGTIQLVGPAGSTTSHSIKVKLCGILKAGDIVRFVICEGTGSTSNCVSYKRTIGKDLDCGSCGEDTRTKSIVKQLCDLGYRQIIIGVHD